MIGQNAENANGSTPPSGNATASARTGTAEATTTATPGSAGLMWWSFVYAATACAPPASAENSAPTGLASGVTNASAMASP